MIEARQVGILAGGRWVVRGIDLNVIPGQVLALVGPNGAGKSTLLRALAGERVPDEGHVLAHGKVLSLLDWARRRMVLPQGTPRAPGLSLEEMVDLGRLPHQTRRGGDPGPEAVSEALAQVELEARRTQSVETLSGGEAQRGAFARGLVQLAGVHGGGYAFLDEPTSALDWAHQLSLLGNLRTLAQRGHGVVCVLHDLNQAGRWADRIALLDQGSLVCHGVPLDVLRPEVLEPVFRVRVEVVERPGQNFPLVLPHPAG